MTIGLKMAEKRHFKKVPDRQTTTTDRRTAHGLLIVGPELKVRIRQKEIFYIYTTALKQIWELSEKRHQPRLHPDSSI